MTRTVNEARLTLGLLFYINILCKSKHTRQGGEPCILHGEGCPPVLQRADARSERTGSRNRRERNYQCSCSLSLKAGRMHRPYPALSLRSGQRSWRLNSQS